MSISQEALEAKAAQQTLAALQEAEKRLDQELHKFDNMGTDDFEELRRKRMQVHLLPLPLLSNTVSVVLVAHRSVIFFTCPSQQLKDEQKKKQEWLQKGHGELSEVSDQTEWFAAVKNNERVVCHFYRPTTWRCDIMEKHLRVLAAKHIETKFIKINAEKSPFLCERLSVVLIPTLVCTKDNFTSDMVEGFDELGGTDDFTTETLAKRLALKGAIFYDEAAITRGKFKVKKGASVSGGAGKPAVRRGGRGGANDSDSDEDGDED